MPHSNTNEFYTRQAPRVFSLCYQTFFITAIDLPRAQEIIIKNSSSVN